MMHRIEGNGEARVVWMDGMQLDPRPSQKHHNHSPDGFNWGYEGSGPAQLALAIMLKVTGEAAYYQDFKREFVATWPQGQDFNVWLDIEAWIEKKQKLMLQINDIAIELERLREIRKEIVEQENTKEADNA